MQSYIIGFVLSVYLTVVAYLLVTKHLFSNRLLIAMIVGLALIQFVVQVFYFLHLGQETKPRWKLVTFIFMLGTVGILVFGTLWIMGNLDYQHIQSPAEIDKTIIQGEGIKPRP